MSVRVSPPPTVDSPVDPVSTAHASPATMRRQVPVPARNPPSRAHGALLFSLACALFAAVGLLYLIQTSAVAGLGLEVSDLQREIAEQSIRNEELAYQLAYYESLPLIEQLAVEQRGMQPMDASIFLTAQRSTDDEMVFPSPLDLENRSLARRALDRLLGYGGSDDDDTGAGQ